MPAAAAAGPTALANSRSSVVAVEPCTILTALGGRKQECRLADVQRSPIVDNNQDANCLAAAAAADVTADGDDALLRYCFSCCTTSKRGCVGRHLANRNELRVFGSDSYALLFLFASNGTM